VRISRAFAFVDLCGFTTFTENHGDREAVAVLAQLRAVLRDELVGTGVRVTKWLGDGALLCSSDTGALLTCCIAVRDRLEAEGRLRLRAGITAGQVVRFEDDDYVGAVLNSAARLCDVARPGQVLATVEAAAGAAGQVATRPVGDVLLRGMRHPLAAVALAACASRPVIARADVSRPSRCASRPCP
jgi:adenylate cyclase